MIAAKPAIVVTTQDLRRSALFRMATEKAKELGAELVVCDDDVDYARTRATLAQEGRAVYGADGQPLP